MSRATVKAGIVTVVRKHSDFTSANAKADDMRVLSPGPARAVRVKYRTHSREYLTIGSVLYNWVFDVEVYVPWRGEQDSVETNMDTEVQKVLGSFDAWPLLSGTLGVVDAVLSEASEVEPVESKRGVYARQRLTCYVQEIITPSRSE